MGNGEDGEQGRLPPTVGTSLPSPWESAHWGHPLFLQTCVPGARGSPREDAPLTAHSWAAGGGCGRGHGGLKSDVGDGDKGVASGVAGLCVGW